MTELFLDGMPAVVNQSANIKLSVENVFFTKSSSYTYDVELPLSVRQNRRIFGNLNRIDIEKNARRLSARLIVDNVTVLIGEAHITSVNESAVKVQLLGEAASYNYGNKADKLYIDELDLGDWFSTTWPDLSYYKNENMRWSGPYYYPEGTKFHGINTRVLFRASDDISPVHYNGQARFVNNVLDGNGNYPWVAYPIHNSSSDVDMNAYAFLGKGFNDTLNFMLGLAQLNPHLSGTSWMNRPFAIQPYLWIMAEKIAAATGLTLNKTDNILFTNPFFNKIFIANNNNFIECNRCLPHWTVNEWWSEIENTFGVVMSIDYETQTMKLSRRSDHYADEADTVYLSNIVDEFTTEINSDTETDISVNNVGFADHENSPFDILSEMIMASAEINTNFSTLNELANWGRTQGAENMRNYKHVIFQTDDGRQYIWVENLTDIPYYALNYYNQSNEIVTIINQIDLPKFTEINMFRPRMSNPESDEVELQLKIVPARYAVRDIEIISGNPYDPINHLSVRMLEAPGIEVDAVNASYGNISIEDELTSDDDSSSSDADIDAPDCLYIAIANPRSYMAYRTTLQLYLGSESTYPKYVTVHYRQAFIHEQMQCSTSGTENSVRHTEAPFSFSLIPIDNQTNLGRETIVNSTTIGTTVRHCFKFIADKIPNTGSIFIIRNKRFVCEKIEANIKPDGLDKLLTGYFYEFDM